MVELFANSGDPEQTQPFALFANYTFSCLQTTINLFHFLDKFSRLQTDYFFLLLFFLENRLVFHVNCLPGRHFA